VSDSELAAEALLLLAVGNDADGFNPDVLD
jgi:hypothetical protein